MPELQFRKAVRKAVPMLLSISSVSGGGKTFSALLVAAGIAGKEGRVGFLDTENGRGSMYADSPGIVAALPNGYEILELTAPFTPARYTECIKAAESAGITVLVVDSGSHEWEGIGGCTEIAEKASGMPDWKTAKREHKRFMYQCLSTGMHLIFCLRAREKVKMVKVGNKTEVTPMGLQPIAEKNFVYEMLLSLQLDERTHFAAAIKAPEPLAHLFAEPRLLTKADGEKIRQWNDVGAKQGEFDQLQKRARASAEDGVAAYESFFKSLSAKERKALADTTHADNKQAAADADRDKSSGPSLPTFTGDWPDAFDGPSCIWNGDRYDRDDEMNYQKFETVTQ